MSDFNNISVIPTDDDMVSLLVDEKAISEKYGMKFEPSIVEDIQALEHGQKVKLIDQFVFSHTDLNFEHSYHYVTGIEKLGETFNVVKNFVYRIKIDGQPEIEHVITKQGEPLTDEDVRNFIQAHVQKSLTDYTDLKYAY